MVAKHLRKHGEGIHHIAFEVDDIEQIYETLKTQGAAIVDDRVISGSRGTKCLFIAPEDFNGVHVELVQNPKYI
jgi:methylmalonyl-CoA/ethylmalonyl-CoA epimerase